jgi:hypothetical protein
MIAFALLLSVLAIYSPAFGFQFILDDHHFVTDPRLQSSGHIWEYLTSYVWAQVRGGPPSFYRPFFVLWLRLNFILAGMSSWGWHVLSVSKHLAAAILLGTLVWRLLRDSVAALAAATLFALHPAQTESVAWVSVPDPVMCAAAIGSLLLYLRYAESVSSVADPIHSERSKRNLRRKNRGKAGNRSSLWWLLASASLCLVALMAKETAVVLPAVIFIVALVMPLARPQQVRSTSDEGRGPASKVVSATRQTLPFFGVTVFYLVLRLNALRGRFSAFTQHLPMETVLRSGPAILWFYVKVLFWPVRPRAFADPNLAYRFSLRGVFLPGLAVCCVVVVMGWMWLWAWRKAQRDLSTRERTGVQYALLLGALILVLPILLTLNVNALNPGDFLHGRYTYMPLAGLMLLLATGWHLASRRRRRVLLAAAGFVAVAFGILTVRQEGAWKNDLTVFTVAHQNAPNNAPVAESLAAAHVQIALGLDEDDRCEEAIPIFQQVIEQYPQNWFAWAGQGECFVKLKNLPKAEESLRRASEISHEARVKEEWQQVRSMMGEFNSSPPL